MINGRQDSIRPAAAFFPPSLVYLRPSTFNTKIFGYLSGCPLPGCPLLFVRVSDQRVSENMDTLIKVQNLRHSVVQSGAVVSYCYNGTGRSTGIDGDDCTEDFFLRVLVGEKIERREVYAYP
jgi:hypothetical protein